MATAGFPTTLKIGVSPNIAASDPYLASSLEARVASSAAIGINSYYISEMWNHIDHGSFTPLDFMELDANIERAQRYLSHKGHFTLRVPDTFENGLPADLAGLSFDDPTVLARATALIDALGDRLDAFDTISIGNETDIYFYTHPDQLAAFSTFFGHVKSAILAEHPNLRVSTTTTFGGMIWEDLRNMMQPVMAQCEFLCLTYYPTDHTYTMRPPETVTQDFPLMFNLQELYGFSSIVLQEVGYSSSGELGNSTEQQRDFVERVMAQVIENRSRFEFVSFFIQNEFPHATISPALTDDSVPESQRFQLYYVNLGLHDQNGMPKPAWGALESALATLNAVTAAGRAWAQYE